MMKAVVKRVEPANEFERRNRVTLPDAPTYVNVSRVSKCGANIRDKVSERGANESDECGRHAEAVERGNDVVVPNRVIRLFHIIEDREHAATTVAAA